MASKFFILIAILLLIPVVSAIHSASHSIGSCENARNYTMTKDVYVIPYIGDIDGHVAPERFYLFSKLAEFFDSNKIKGAMSFYPATINSHNKFMEPFIEMYNSPYIELIQKGNDGNEEEARMAQLPIERQKEIIVQGQENFREKMSDALGTQEIVLPESYNQIQGSFSQETLKAAGQAGINQYFDVFVASGMKPVKSTGNFTVIQYGVGFAYGNNTVGPNTSFKTADQILCEIDLYERADIEIASADGRLIVPLWTHQQDFEDPQADDYINENKWRAYRETLLRLKQSPKVEFLLPEEVHEKLLVNSLNESLISQSKSQCFSPVAISEKVVVEEDPKIRMCEKLDIYLPGFSVDLAKNCKDVIRYLLKDLAEIDNLEPTLNKSFVADYQHFLYQPSLIIDENSSLHDAEKIVAENSERKTQSEVDINGSHDIEINGGMYVDKINVKFPEGYSEEINVEELELCGAELPGLEDRENLIVCTWKGCKRGAVSISADDYSTTCRQELEAQGFRGTYYLSNTNEYTEEMWEAFRNMSHTGHELGTHTRDHKCIYDSARHYKGSLEDNKKDISKNTGIPEENIISHSYPCGYGTEKDMEVTESLGYLSARGYNLNELENQVPENFFYLKSFNEKEYPGGDLTPPSYDIIVEQAQEQGKWANLVFHNDFCSDEGIISELSAKSLWVDTVGNVAKYIHLRENVIIEGYEFDNQSKITFDVTTPGELQEEKYSQALTLKLGIKDKEIESLLVNGEETEYEWNKDIFGNYILFDVPFPVDSEVEVKLNG